MPLAARADRPHAHHRIREPAAGPRGAGGAAARKQQRVARQAGSSLCQRWCPWLSRPLTRCCCCPRRPCRPAERGSHRRLARSLRFFRPGPASFSPLRLWLLVSSADRRFRRRCRRRRGRRLRQRGEKGDDDDVLQCSSKQSCLQGWRKCSLLTARQTFSSPRRQPASPRYRRCRSLSVSCSATPARGTSGAGWSCEKIVRDTEKNIITSAEKER